MNRAANIAVSASTGATRGTLRGTAIVGTDSIVGDT